MQKAANVKFECFSCDGSHQKFIGELINFWSHVRYCPGRAKAKEEVSVQIDSINVLNLA
jgi:hypothetical protein